MLLNKVQWPININKTYILIIKSSWLQLLWCWRVSIDKRTKWGTKFTLCWFSKKKSRIRIGPIRLNVPKYAGASEMLYGMFSPLFYINLSSKYILGLCHLEVRSGGRTGLGCTKGWNHVWRSISTLHKTKSHDFIKFSN